MTSHVHITYTILLHISLNLSEALLDDLYVTFISTMCSYTDGQAVASGTLIRNRGRTNAKQVQCFS